jgi:hypothetical protein
LAAVYVKLSPMGKLFVLRACTIVSAVFWVAVGVGVDADCVELVLQAVRSMRIHRETIHFIKKFLL